MTQTGDRGATSKGSEPSSSRRRAFLSHSGAFLSGVASSLTGNFLSARTTLPGFLNKQPVDPDIDLAKLLDELFSAGGDVRWYAGGAHYLVGGVHSDNTAVQQDLVHVVGTVAAVVTENEKARAFELDQAADWILVGGPHSSTLAASLLDASVGVRNNRSANLRFAYETDKKLVTLKRYRAGGELQEQSRRSWIRDLKNHNIYRPDEGDWLEEDYLLITRMVQSFKGARHYRTIIGGTHGIGTRAVVGFLRGPGREGKLRHKIAGAATGTFQILAKVKARSEEGKTVPRSVEVVDVHVA